MVCLPFGTSLKFLPSQNASSMISAITIQVVTIVSLIETSIPPMEKENSSLEEIALRISSPMSPIFISSKKCSLIARSN